MRRKPIQYDTTWRDGAVLSSAGYEPKPIGPRTSRAQARRTNSDAGVPLRDVQIAARYADPRTTTLYDRRRENFDRHAAYVRRRRCGRRLTKPSARRGRNFGKAPIAQPIKLRATTSSVWRLHSWRN